jgi:uncharacterized membrane protein
MAESSTARLETFCDGVFAIALTLLIIDIKLPPDAHFDTTAGFWLTLKHLIPLNLAFLLSFIVILITWVNHHEACKLVNKSSPQYMYANGLLLLTVVFIPFPTALVGDYVFTGHAAPAVVLYSGVFTLQAVAWCVIPMVALKPSRPLVKNEKAAQGMRIVLKNGKYAVVIYSGFTILAFWFPQIIALIVALSWLFWLVYGVAINKVEA